MGEDKKARERPIGRKGLESRCNVTKRFGRGVGAVRSPGLSTARGRPVLTEAGVSEAGAGPV